MIEIARATKAEMIAAFLAAEINSSRYGAIILARLREHGIPRRMIEEPNLHDEAENKARRIVLVRYRGYPDALLFTGFPHQSAKWRRVRLQAEDFERMRYAAEPDSLIPLSGPARLVTAGARNFSAGVPAAAKVPHVLGIVTAIQQGATFPPLIAVQDHDASLILMEGNSRATAYVIAGNTESGIEALVATAPSFENWRYY